MTDSIKRICLWSGPRNISTALMYSFAQREDTKVFDEPLYAFYLANSKAKEYHPGAEDILKSMENDGQKVIDVMLNDYSKPVLFFKHMTKHLLDLDKGFLKDVNNVILTRDPEDMLPSFDKVIEQPTMEDVGYKHHLDLIHYFDANAIKYVVLDSKKVLINPEKVLKQLCNFINITFDENMLYWQAGSRKEDGIWAKYWYKNVHQSTGFQPYKPNKNRLPEHLKPLLTECKPIYSKLNKMAIG